MPTSPTAFTGSTDAPTVNLAVLRGSASGPAELRMLDSGTRLATLAVRVPSLRGPATSVPVSVFDPPAWLETLAAGDPVVVVGAIRRRFYRPLGGGVNARVEVEARLVGRGGDRRRVETALRHAEAALEALL
jgi:hypothetical protein